MTQGPRIYRDNIQGITKPALKRLGYVAGVRQLSGVIYEELRGIIMVTLENILRPAVTYAQFHKKHTVTEAMVTAALTNSKMALPGVWSTDPSDRSCPVRKTGQRKSKKSSPEEKTKKRSRKSKKGTRALKEIRLYQKQWDCLHIPRTVFSRLVREIALNYKTDLRFTKRALLVLQYALERYLVELLAAAQLEAIHAKRIGVMPKDIQLARTMRE